MIRDRESNIREDVDMQQDPLRNPSEPGPPNGGRELGRGEWHGVFTAAGIAGSDQLRRREGPHAEGPHAPAVALGRVSYTAASDDYAPEASRIPSLVGAKLPLRYIRSVATEVSTLDDVLSCHQFLSQLQREKRRSDRSGSPLSLALFHFDDGLGDEAIEQRLRVIHESKRETDILGYLDHDLLGVLLPDTGADGNARFIQKVIRRASGVTFTTSAATYPDQLFDSLAAGDRAHLRHSPMFIEQAPASHLGDFAKRSIDVVGASVAIALFAPLMLVTALLVAATSPGPIIYKQTRLGRRGVPFVFYKFRSMHCNADSTIHRDHVTTIIKGSQGASGGDGAEGAAWRKLEGDPRITNIGRVIRKTSIDELPQLFSVLKGDMSLVGPRPPLRYEAEAYQPWHLRRVLEIKPGITGLWQVAGRGSVSFDEMVRMDLRYIRERSLRLDLKILLRTVLVVLRRDGAS